MKQHEWEKEQQLCVFIGMSQSIHSPYSPVKYFFLFFFFLLCFTVPSCFPFSRRMVVSFSGLCWLYCIRIAYGGLVHRFFSSFFIHIVDMMDFMGLLKVNRLLCCVWTELSWIWLILKAFVILLDELIDFCFIFVSFFFFCVDFKSNERD